MSALKKYDEVEKLVETKRLQEEFFLIGKNYEIAALEKLQTECENFLVKNKDEEISDLVQIIGAIIVYTKNYNREVARGQVKRVWKKLIVKEKFSLYEIRILIPILFVASSTEELIKVTNKCLDDLGYYRFDQLYIKLRILLLLNLMRMLIDDKFFSEDYRLKYDKLINEATDEIIELNAECKENYNTYVALATIHKGMVTKDKTLFRVGIALLESEQFDLSKIDRAIKFYMERYNFII